MRRRATSSARIRIPNATRSSREIVMAVRHAPNMSGRREQLDDDGEVVGVPQEPVGTPPHQWLAGQHQDADAPALPQRPDGGIAERLRGEPQPEPERPELPRPRTERHHLGSQAQREEHVDQHDEREVAGAVCPRAPRATSRFVLLAEWSNSPTRCAASTTRNSVSLQIGGEPGWRSRRSRTGFPASAAPRRAHREPWPDSSRR